MSFLLELDHVDRTWVEAAYGPDAVYFSIRGDSKEITGYDHLYHFLRLYERLCLQRENTQNRFSVVEVDSGIHIVSVPVSASRSAFSTTYDEALSEVSRFLAEIFERLEDTDDTGWESQAARFNSFLDEFSFSEIYSNVLND